MTAKSRLLVWIFILFVLLAAQGGLLLAYTINKDLKYTILDAIYEGSSLFKQPAYWYLAYTDKLHDSSSSSYELLSFTLSSYGQRGVKPEDTLRVAGLLLSRGMDVNAYNAKGNTVLHEAVVVNQPDVVKFLLAHGADTERNTRHLGSERTNNLTPLQLAEWLHGNSRSGGDWQAVIDLLRVAEHKQ